jgi:hypothetical protein
MARLQDFTQPLIGDLDIAYQRTLQERDALTRGYKSPNFPQFVSGARAKLTVNGKTIGAALEVSYTISANMTELRTIDQFLPWEIVPGQVSIKANLRRIVDPNRSLAGDSLFSTLQSYLHQPYAALEIRDKLGNLIFYAKGMFTDVQGNIQNGQLGIEGASFVGYYWRENVKQEYAPVQESLERQMTNGFTQNSMVKRVSSIFK